jgi:deoxyribodipyrimidine photo-lyase
VSWKKPKNIASLKPDFDILPDWKLDRSVATVTQWPGGSQEARRLLDDFVKHNLDDYGTGRNKPENDHTSRLSPYLHFGHIGPLTVALAAKNSGAPEADKADFLNQIINWPEFSINLVRFNPDYDNFECCEPWAHRTLAKHARDRRTVTYTETQLQNAETHDPLWNAAQMRMVNTGRMHNYMRMYWAKKILEWSSTPAEA